MPNSKQNSESTAKYIFVTGGVTSSLGKGIVASSLGRLLQESGYRVTIQKLDPYLNIDPGTLNPYEHGECYVTEDGAETDLDLGHYERFLNTPTSKANNVTTGSIYQNVINKEREGKFLGKTVQIIPHITDEIKHCIKKLSLSKKYDIIITEIGGTVGDIESLPFLESVRQLKWELGGNAIVIHLTLIPFLSSAGELKTKPSQHSVRFLQEQGIFPDILVCRTERKLPQEVRDKLALFCNVKTNAVIESIDAKSIYEVPLLMEEEKLDEVVLEKLNLSPKKKPELKEWKQFLDHVQNTTNTINIALIGKYIQLKDSYKSIAESLTHAGATTRSKINIQWIDSENINPENASDLLKNCDGILVAPGFGERGIEGKINAVKYARENKIPFLGICLGMQMAVIEFARNVLKLENAHSSEIESTCKNPVIDVMENQKNIINLGGSMRLGNWECSLDTSSKVYKYYDSKKIVERHRHRYEFNNNYKELFEKNGVCFSGINKENIIEIIEIKDHPWFVGVQFHPEYKSTVLQPHPLFLGFLDSILKIKK